MTNKDALAFYTAGCCRCMKNCNECETDLAINALEKQIPLNTKLVYDGDEECGNCGSDLGANADFWSYCPYCGQKIG